MAEPQKKPSAAKAQASAEAPAEQPQEQLTEQPPVEESKPESNEEPTVPESTEVRFTRDQLLDQSVLMLGTSRYIADAVLPNEADKRWTEQEARGLVDKFLKQKVEVE